MNFKDFIVIQRWGKIPGQMTTAQVLWLAARRILFIVCCSLQAFQIANAQVYPVNVTPQLIPPYSLKLSDYQSTASEKLFVNLLLTDIPEMRRQVRLKMKIEGQGLMIQSREVVLGAPPLFLDGGVNVRLSNLDLRPYFELQNLEGISPRQYQSPLPDGLYRFCFEVYDFFSGQQISNSMGCAMVYLQVNDPPFLNIPTRGELIPARVPQNVLFNWTPRHLNATNVDYEFTIKEIWDNGQDPQAAFLASPVWYQRHTRATTLLLGPGDAQLLEGKTYAWRVRAIVSDGISETSVFRNDGYSEIFYFVYQQACKAPEFSIAEAVDSQSIQVRWQSAEQHVRYRVQYRKKGFGENDWFAQGSDSTERLIRNLEPNTTYEYRVGGQCSGQDGLAYTAIQEVTTPEDAPYYDCGLAPEQVRIDNRDPLPILGVNEVFTVGDFPVTVKQASGSNGRYSGWGYVVIPFLGDTRIGVGFRDVSINTDYQLFKGVVETDYDPSWGNVFEPDRLVLIIEEQLNAIENQLQKLVEVVQEGLTQGTFESEEAEALQQILSAQQTEFEQEKQTLVQKTEELEKEVAKDPQEEDKVEQLKEALVTGQEKLREIQTALDHLSEELGVGTTSSEQQPSTGYFDGSFAFTDTTDKISRPDDSSTLVVLPKDHERSSTFINQAFTIEGKPYRIVITTDTSSATAQEQARRLADNPEGTTLYYHYDFEKNQLFYKINFNDNFFGAVSGDDLVEIRNSHRQAIANVLAQEGQGVTADKILKNLVEINRLFFELINNLQLPEWLWNPETEGYIYFGPNGIDPARAGVIDGVLEEISGVALLVSLGVGYITDPERKAQIDADLNDFEFTKVVDDFVEERKALYEEGSPAEIEHQSGKDLVGAASLLTGVGAALKVIKKGATFTKELAEGVKRWGDDLAQLLAKQKRRLQNLKNQYGNLDFVDFRPVGGKTAADITSSMYNDMFANLANRSISNADRGDIIEKVLRSGNTIPQKVTYKQGTELYKVVKKGTKPSDITEYWFTKTELDNLMAQGTNFESKAGLPLGSMADEYDIYKITANQSSTTYRSTIAPTIQRGYTTTGGAQQTLVLDRSTWSVPIKHNTQPFIPDF